MKILSKGVIYFSACKYNASDLIIYNQNAINIPVTDLDPVYTVPDSRSHDIEFGQFAVLPFFLGLVDVKFFNIIINLRTSLVLKVFNLISWPCGSGTT